jgi:hypothetical protein
MTSVTVTESNYTVVTTENDVVIVQTQLQGPQGPSGDGAPGNNDVGVIYLKNNAVATTIGSANARAVVAGSMQTGELYNFAKDATTNSLKYSGLGGKFHIVATFNFATSSQNVCGFYVGHNTDDTTALNADADRISESEIYINASTTANQPVGGAIQTVLDLQPDDRVYFIVQNRDAANDITVQFLKFTATSLTAEKGDQGAAGINFPRSITIVEPVINDAFTVFYTTANTTISSVRALVQGIAPSVTFVLKADPDRNAAGTAVITSTTATNTTTGIEAVIINQPIPVDHYVWVEITAVSGTVTEFNLSIAF